MPTPAPSESEGARIIVLRPGAIAPPTRTRWRRRAVWVAALWGAFATASWLIVGVLVYGSYFATLAVLDLLRG